MYGAGTVVVVVEGGFAVVGGLAATGGLVLGGVVVAVLVAVVASRGTVGEVRLDSTAATTVRTISTPKAIQVVHCFFTPITGYARGQDNLLRSALRRQHRIHG
jgi:hypothetical protein